MELSAVIAGLSAVIAGLSAVIVGLSAVIVSLPGATVGLSAVIVGLSAVIVGLPAETMGLPAETVGLPAAYLPKRKNLTVALIIDSHTCKAGCTTRILRARRQSRRSELRWGSGGAAPGKFSEFLGARRPGDAIWYLCSLIQIQLLNHKIYGFGKDNLEK